MSLHPSSSSSLLFFLLFFFLNPFFSSSQKILSSFNSKSPPWNPTQNQILLSPNSTFAAGFLQSSQNSFNFSIWYYKIPVKTVVWSANPNSPLNSSATLFISSSGELKLTPSTSSSAPNLWPSIIRNTSSVLFLQEDGSLVYANWNSFLNPTDTYLPTQNITGTNLTSGNGKFQFDGSNLNTLFFDENDSYFTFPQNALQRLEETGEVTQVNGRFFSSDFGEKGKLRRMKLDEDGNMRIYSFDLSSSLAENWTIVWEAVNQLCTIHGTCGTNSICLYDTSTTQTSCVCPPGFRKDASKSCVRKIPLMTKDSKASKYLPLDFVSFTGVGNQTDLKALSFSSCEKNCSDKNDCLGFLFKYDGTGYCVLVLEKLLYGYWSPGTEFVMYLRVDSKENDISNFTGLTSLMETSCPVRISLPFPPEESKTTTRNIVIISTIFAAELISGVFFFWAFLKKYIKYRDMARTFGLEVMPAIGPKRFSFSEIKNATNDFTDKIGRGGFGDVYKGKLSDGRVVAVKCLKNVKGGDAEFWAEVTIIARMHHLNLVRLWGFCAEKGRRILVYEYVPNGSLGEFLFQKSQIQSPDGQKPILDWNIRYRIALGVARAIAYLHEECLEWVLHCDIKPENILLGDDFCPKVSDFGLAKLKKKEEMMTMSRFRGTPGYVAPEWTKADPITPKADVYSFGLVLLEIVSGTRNFEHHNSKVESDQWFFPAWAFDKVFKDMNVDDILDPQIKQSYDSRAHFDLVNRMVKTAMWCIQDQPDARPSMGKVAKMLEGTVEIIEPKKPTIFFLSEE
ncbi:G-type lectin S-receptor-like serine/threonine-protein kinase At1g34300 [Solanum stenotomum]|uniref:G-type lectin S-receptor-like serine/threonine-protein kinase At1g34300 n=1 Tax=Solanum stenotomum TaxID=172797 RepID=UPI0020D02AE4|nr:G-type lectin S-receptor-like serine/threonine-protein kinase At1g34300 [Solanum stenotomum]